jgi:hypothetical protein
MKIHIQRRHASMLGEGSLRSQLQSLDSQVFSNIGNSLYKTNNDYLKDNYNYSYVHQEDPPSSKNYYHNDPQFFQEQGQSVRCAKGSYGIHTEHIDGCRRQFCMYLSFKDDKNNDL